uniref:7-cyano-7-deazaguanine synthase n=1 Tax=viral metagenome TaxID=1070528 RepID=A0A6H1ZVT1_9ZZZZ
MKNKKSLILYSGGADSRLLLELAHILKIESSCLLVNYGQKHIKELEVAEKLCISKGLQYNKIYIDLPVESKLTGQGIVGYEGVSEWYVPSRNLIFISIAVSIAESRGIDTIWYGADFSDRINLFPDCYQEWVVGINRFLEINGSKQITVEAPLLGFSKEIILSLLEYLGIDKSEIFSGYGGLENENEKE